MAEPDARTRYLLSLAIALPLLASPTVTADGGASRGDPAAEQAAEILESLADQVFRVGPHGLPRPATDDDFYPRDAARERLGRLLFHDKILSGNENISCATCHHPLTDTGDGLSLPIGEGARGLGITRNTGVGQDAVEERVPRNAPPVFNLGAREFTRMFHDGRVELVDGAFRSPAGADLPPGLDNVLAVQAMFPVTSGTEMAGQAGENPVADAAAAGDLAGPEGVWAQLAARLREIPEYVTLFVNAFDDVDGPADLDFVHAANAIAAYEAAAFRAADSPFDRFLRGDRRAMSPSARRGMRLFYGQTGCGSCHAGTFQTDQRFHAIAMPQIGPGKGDDLPGFDDGLDDFGRERVTGLGTDRFRFRTPSLRNVALTGPWGHDGAYDTLEAVVRHHVDPVAAMQSYDTGQAVLPSRPDLDALDFACHKNVARRAAVAAACELAPVHLSARQLGELVDFLHALTDPASVDLRSASPMTVPSGLPVYE